MSLPGAEARRFVHCGYSTSTWETTFRFLRDGLLLQPVASEEEAGQTSTSDGGILGIEGPMVTRSTFFYDHRGPRNGPGIELQAWVDPVAVGTPYADPQQLGFQAIGIGTAELEATVTRAESMGAKVLDKWPDDGTPQGGAGATLVTPDGTTVDLAERAPFDGGGTVLEHMRLSVSDLGRSIAYYGDLGFEVSARWSTRDGASVLGARQPAQVDAARLVLPTGPFALVLTQWREPPSHGQPYSAANNRGLYRFALFMADTRAAVHSLASAGHGVLRPARRVDMGATGAPDMWIGFVLDPDGIPVQLASTG